MPRPPASVGSEYADMLDTSCVQADRHTERPSCQRKKLRVRKYRAVVVPPKCPKKGSLNKSSPSLLMCVQEKLSI
jgi:hypothetical protein